MTRVTAPPRIGYVLKRFPRLSETFILNEILELERRGVEVVIFSLLKPNEGRFHAQIATLKAQVFYLEGLDPRRWSTWLLEEWPALSTRAPMMWDLLGEALERGDLRRIDEILWGAWVASRARKSGLSHLHSHFGTISSSIAWFAHRISGIPFSFTAHAKDIFAYTMEEHHLREKMADATRVVTVTRFNKRYLLEGAPEIDADHVKVIHNGIDLERFNVAASRKRESDLILSVGRLIPKKGFGDLLDACAHLKERRVSFRCLIVGEGPEAPALEHKRRMLGLEREVTFTGPRNQDEVVSLMHQATAFVLPCKVGPDKNQDALPTVLLEALACGTPCVSTTLSGVPEIIDSGVDGILVPPEDPRALSAGIEHLLSSPQLREQFAKKGRDKAIAKFDLRTNVGTLLEVLTSDGAVRVGPAAAARRSRVLYLCADRGIPFGGTKGGSVHVREFVEALQEKGYAPTVLAARRDHTSLYRPSYPVHPLPDKLGLPIPYPGDKDNGRWIAETEAFRNQAVQQLLLDIHRGAGFDVIYERYSLYGTAGRVFAQKAGIPFVLEVNAPLVSEAARYRQLEDVGPAKDVEAYLFSTADHIVAVSNSLRDYILAVAPGARVTVVPNGVNLERFNKTIEKPSWRSRITMRPDRDFVVGFVGRVRPWHGVDLLIDALGDLAKTDDRFSLCVVGQAGELQEELETRLRSHGLDGRVRFIGPVPPEVVPVVLQSMDVVVAPYPDLPEFYFSPLKIFEYMAAGKPIVATSTGQIAEILTDGQSALLVPPGDVPALGEALRRLRDDPGLRRRLGGEARSQAVRKHSWHRRLEAIGAVLENLSAGASAERIAHARTVSTSQG
ncbi:MAG: glycosyltransferase family 4 protein [Candidatus Krumholzibacteriia bacterium]